MKQTRDCWQLYNKRMEKEYYTSRHKTLTKTPDGYVLCWFVFPEFLILNDGFESAANAASLNGRNMNKRGLFQAPAAAA